MRQYRAKHGEAYRAYKREWMREWRAWSAAHPGETRPRRPRRATAERIYTDSAIRDADHQIGRLEKWVTKLPRLLTDEQSQRLNALASELRRQGMARYKRDDAA
jgi:hypothetical protein